VLCILHLQTAEAEAVADLEIFRRGFSFTKMPVKLEKKGHHQLFESFFTHSSKFTL